MVDYYKKYIKYKNKYNNLKYSLDNRYVIFAGETYYPSEGWKDFYDVAKTLEDAKKISARALKENDWVQIIDFDHKQIVEINYREPEY